MKRRYILTGIIALLMSCPAIGAEIDLSRPSQENAALRSAVLPGWGQYFNGYKVKAGIVAGVEACLVGASLLYLSKANSTYDDYSKKGSADDPLYDDYESQLNTATVFAAAAAAGWIYSIIDAYVFSPYSDGPDSYADRFTFITARDKLEFNVRLARL